MGYINVNSLMGGVSVADATMNLTGNNPTPEGYAKAASSLVETAASALKSLKNVLPAAQYADLVASYNKMENDTNKSDGSRKVSNIIAFVSDLVELGASYPALPVNIKLALYTTSAGLTALSWWYSKFIEEPNEANALEQQRLEELFKKYQILADDTWNNEAWNDDLVLVYQVEPASAVENKTTLRFKIRFNHELDKEIKMQYHTIGKTATQDEDYFGVDYKNPREFIVPAGVNEWFIDITIKDDYEKEDDEYFYIEVNVKCHAKIPH